MTFGLRQLSASRAFTVFQICMYIYFYTYVHISGVGFMARRGAFVRHKLGLRPSSGLAAFCDSICPRATVTQAASQSVSQSVTQSIRLIGFARLCVTINHTQQRERERERQREGNRFGLPSHPPLINKLQSAISHKAFRLFVK